MTGKKRKLYATTCGVQARGQEGDKVADGLIYFRHSKCEERLGEAPGGHGWPAAARH